MKKNIGCIFIINLFLTTMNCGNNSDPEVVPGVASETLQNEAASAQTIFYNIGGTLSGLSPGNTLVLGNNNEELVLESNGDFIFKNPQSDFTAYNISILSQPVGQVCTVNQGSGTVSGSAINTVSITCSIDAYTVGGNLSGLVSGELILQNNGSDNITLTSDGTFVFSSPVAYGANFNVTIMTMPPGLVCSVSGGIGVMASGNVDTVGINCLPAMFTVGGNLTGLAMGKLLIIENNGGDSITLDTNGNFIFSLEIASGYSFLVSIGQQPAGQTCNVVNASGIVGTDPITSVSIECKNNSYLVGGIINGAGGALTLQNNGIDNLEIQSPGNFIFNLPVEYGAVYFVSIINSPTGQVCTISNATGTMGNSDISNITIDCINATTVGGVLTGLAPGREISVLLNLGNSLTLKSNQAFNFNVNMVPGTTYDVSIDVEPVGQVCTVLNGNGLMATTNITDIIISCSHSLIINEVDYDNAGTDSAEFVEIFNGGHTDISLAGYYLVLVNGFTNSVYNTYDLSLAGVIQPGQYLVVGSSVAVAPLLPGVLKIDLGTVVNEIQNGAPDGVALIDVTNAALVDALSYEGQIISSTISQINSAVSLVEGLSLDPMIKDSATTDGALCRYPNGSDANNSANDWTFCSVPTPGSDNLP